VAYLLLFKVFDEYMNALKSYGDLSILPTRYFLEPLEIGEEVSVEIETGKTLFIKLLAVGPIDPINGRREVYFELNGEARVLTVVDKRSRKIIRIYIFLHDMKMGCVSVDFSSFLFKLLLLSGRKNNAIKSRSLQSRRNWCPHVWRSCRNPTQR
jgi:pyruvate carboxylase